MTPLLTAWNLTRGVAGGMAGGVALAERLETADSLWAKFLGLMGRPSLAPGSGLWLPGSNGIHMMFMRFPIDCVFLARPDADGARRVVAVRRGLRPWIGAVWYVRGAHGVLELPAGTIEATGTRIGDVVRIEPAGGARKVASADLRQAAEGGVPEGGWRRPESR